MSALSSFAQTVDGSLYQRTQTVLKHAAANSSDLSELNEVGVYHKIAHPYGPPLVAKYREKGQAPGAWISQGTFPGVWCALFNPRNTFSFAVGNLTFLRLTFKAEYKVFDPKNPEHLTLWELWTQSNPEKPNPWALEKNSRGETMEERMRCGIGFGNIVLSNPMPGHREFYRDNHFGAAVGYSDYMSLVVLQTECIETLTVVSL